MWSLYGYLRKDATGATHSTSFVARPRSVQLSLLINRWPSAVLLPNFSGLCVGLYFSFVFHRFSAKPIGAAANTPRFFAAYPPGSELDPLRAKGNPAQGKCWREGRA